MPSRARRPQAGGSPECHPAHAAHKPEARWNAAPHMPPTSRRLAGTPPHARRPQAGGSSECHPAHAAHKPEACWIVAGGEASAASGNHRIASPRNHAPRMGRGKPPRRIPAAPSGADARGMPGSGGSRCAPPPATLHQASGLGTARRADAPAITRPAKVSHPA